MNSDSTQVQYQAGSELLQSQCDRFFSCLNNVDSPKDLEMSVVKAVHLRQRKAAKIHLGFLAFIAGFSCTGIVYAIGFIGRSFYETGFYQYTSLLFSGDASFLAYWQEIAFSIIESLPLFTIAAFLAATALFLWSLVRASQDANIIIATGHRRVA